MRRPTAPKGRKRSRPSSHISGTTLDGVRRANSTAGISAGDQVRTTQGRRGSGSEHQLLIQDGTGDPAEHELCEPARRARTSGSEQRTSSRDPRIRATTTCGSRLRRRRSAHPGHARLDVEDLPRSRIIRLITGAGRYTSPPRVGATSASPQKVGLAQRCEVARKQRQLRVAPRAQSR